MYTPQSHGSDARATSTQKSAKPKHRTFCYRKRKKCPKRKALEPARLHSCCMRTVHQTTSTEFAVVSNGFMPPTDSRKNPTSGALSGVLQASATPGTTTTGNRQVRSVSGWMAWSWLPRDLFYRYRCRRIATIIIIIITNGNGPTALHGQPRPGSARLILSGLTKVGVKPAHAASGYGSGSVRPLGLVASAADG